MNSDPVYGSRYACAWHRFASSSHWAYDDGDRVSDCESQFYQWWVAKYEAKYITMCLQGLQGTNYGMMGDKRAHIFDSGDDNPGHEPYLRHSGHDKILDDLSELVKGMVSRGNSNFFRLESGDGFPVSLEIYFLAIKSGFERTCSFLSMGMRVITGFEDHSSEGVFTPSSPVPGPSYPLESVPRSKTDHVFPFFEAAIQTAEAIEELGNDRFVKHRYVPILKKAVDHADKLVEKLLALMDSSVHDTTSQPLKVKECRVVTRETVHALGIEWRLRILPFAGDMFEYPDAEVTSGSVAEILGHVLGFVVLLCCRAESALAGMMLLARNFVGIMRKSLAQPYATTAPFCSLTLLGTTNVHC
jgi:hypothetical protein